MRNRAPLTPPPPALALAPAPARAQAPPRPRRPWASSSAGHGAMRHLRAVRPVAHGAAAAEIKSPLRFELCACRRGAAPSSS
eukprot:4343772-Prymnesium_polylepis.1